MNFMLQPSGKLFTQSQQSKHQNVWNLFKLKNKDATITSMSYSGDFSVNFEQISQLLLCFHSYFEQVITNCEFYSQKFEQTQSNHVN